MIYVKGVCAGIICLEEEASGGVMCAGGMCRDHVFGGGGKWGVMCVGGMCRDHVAEGIMCLEEEASGGVMCVGGMCRDHAQKGSCVGVMCKPSHHVLKCACPCHDIMLIGVHVANHVDLHLMA